MRGDTSGSSPALNRTGSARHRLVGPGLAAVLGCSVALYGLYVAGVDPWLWWSDYRERNRMPATAQVTRPPTAGVVQPEPIGTDSSISASPRRLVLKSTRRGKNAMDGTAALGIHAGSPQVYRAGALLANGARIVEIHEDSIVLERDGLRAQVYVEGEEPANYVAKETPLLLVGGDAPALAAVPTSSDTLTDVMRVTPVFDGDSVSALEVHGNERSDAFSKLGLQPGDQITVVNGTPVTDVSTSVAALRRLTHGEALQVTIKRQGQLQTISLDGLVITPRASGTSG